MIITGIEVEALTSLFLHSLLITSILGFFLGSILYSLYRILVRKINIPKRIKTKDGYLYRTNAGFYVKKELLDSLNAEFKHKHRQRWIAHHQRQIDLLSKS